MHKSFLLGFLVLIAGCDSPPPGTSVEPSPFPGQLGGHTTVLPPAPLPGNFPSFNSRELALMEPGHRQMVQRLLDIGRRSSDENDYTGSRTARRLRAALAQLSTNPLPPENLLRLRITLAEEELHLGREKESIKQFEHAIDLSRKMYGTTPPTLLFWLGVAHLRTGETENCCRRATPGSCILPIRDEAIHTKPAGSQQARKMFLSVLEQTPKESPLYYRALWLLNIAAMTIGDYPGGVPSQYQIPPAEFTSTSEFPPFTNIAQEMGVNGFSSSGGAIGEDFDGDGAIDLVVSSWNEVEQVRFLRNNQDGTFSDNTEAAGLKGILGGLNLVHADYNNDGHPDFLVLRGGWLGAAGRHPNSLLRNNGDGTFTDVTIHAGLATVNAPTQTATWADFNNDGLVDLFVGNEMEPCQLYMNQGDETFVDTAKRAGVTNERFSKGTVAGDFNADGLIDIYLSNYGDKNRLYQNNGDGTFTDVAKHVGVQGPRESFPCWFWDYNNDGHLDLYVSSFAATIDHVAKDYLDLPLNIELNQLYQSNGKGGFNEVSKSLGLTAPTATMGSNFGDLDNDGYLDFYLGTGNTSYTDIMPNLMYRNRQGESFVDVTLAGRFGHLQKGHAVVFADFDQDGHQDVFQQMGGAFPGDRYFDALYHNPGNDHHWISLRLHGRSSHRSSLGARIHVTVAQEGTSRSIYRWVNSGGSFGSKPLRQEIGLGTAESIESIRIRWPGDEREQLLEDLAIDCHHVVVQPPEQPLGK